MELIAEFVQVLMDAWRAAREAADLAGRLRAWWWVVRHRNALDTPGGWIVAYEVSE